MTERVVADVASAVITPVCLVPIIGQPFPAVHRTLEFRVAMIDGRPFFFFTCGSAEDDVLVTRLHPTIEGAFGDVQAWIAWLMEAPGVMVALADLAADSYLRSWTAPPVGQ